MESQKIMESQKLKELQNQRAKALEKLKKACRECSPKRRKSEFVTCPKCGSRYPRKYILECGYTCYPCRVCEDRRSLYSATSIKRIENLERKFDDIEALVNDERERLIAQIRGKFNEIYDEFYNGDTYEIYGASAKSGDAIHYTIMIDTGAVYKK